MLRFLISLFVFAIALPSDGSEVSANQENSDSSDKYIRVPISLDTKNFELRFGKEKSHEFTLSFGAASNVQKNQSVTSNHSTLIRRDIWSNVDEGAWAWIQDDFYQAYEEIHDYNYDHDYNLDLGIGYTKYFNTVQKEKYNRSFYLSSSMQIAYHSRKSTRTESHTGYEIDVEPSESPSEGDFSGESWVEDKVWIYKDTDAYSSFYPAINFDIGTRFDVKSDLFNIKDLSLSFDVIWAGLNINTSISKNMDKIEYNCDIPNNTNAPGCSEEYHPKSRRPPNDSVNIAFNGPSIGLFFKYNF